MREIGVISPELLQRAADEAQQIIQINRRMIGPGHVSFSQHVSYQDRHFYGIAAEIYMAELLGMSRRGPSQPARTPDLDGWLEIKTIPIIRQAAFSPARFTCYVDDYCCDSDHYAMIQTVIFRESGEIWSVGWLPGAAMRGYPLDTRKGHTSRRVIPMSELGDTLTGLPELIG